MRQHQIRSQKSDATYLAPLFKAAANAVLLVLLLWTFSLLSILTGCATTPNTAVTTGSDNATVLAGSDSGLSPAQLLQYVSLAEQEALTAWQLHESTKDATALEKVTWWLKYASGVAARIEALSATGS